MSSQPALLPVPVALTADDLTALEESLNAWLDARIPGGSEQGEIRLQPASLHELSDTIHAWLSHFVAGKKLLLKASVQH